MKARHDIRFGAFVAGTESDVGVEESGWVRLFFVEDCLPYSWALFARGCVFPVGISGGTSSLPLVQRSPADVRERTRTGAAPAGAGVGAQPPARTSRPTRPERGCWFGRGHQGCGVLGAARARKPRRNGLRHDAGCGFGLGAARSRRLASSRCGAEPATGALPGRDAPQRDDRDRLAGTTAYALEATVVLDIIHVAATTGRAVLVAGS